MGAVGSSICCSQPDSCHGDGKQCLPTHGAPVLGPREDTDELIVETSAAETGPKVATLILSGEEDPATIIRRGGLELTWRSGGKRHTVRSFRERPMRRAVSADFLLPPLYLQFLDREFVMTNGDLDNALRSGNDNNEIILVLPADYVADARRLVGFKLGRHILRVHGFLSSQAEMPVSAPGARVSTPGWRKDYKSEAQPECLFFALRTSRPKADIMLDKAAFGIPSVANLYLFAESHLSVAHMDEQDRLAFETCIQELPESGPRMQKLSLFLKVFYEGGFAYSQKLDTGGSTYLPQNVGIACLSVTRAWPGQSGIEMGFPYLLPSRFLRFADTVPVMIKGISDISTRHKRYGLCFTRCVFLWAEDTFEHDKTLEFCSLLPQGGFYYVPASMKLHWKHGGFLYPFGQDRRAFETVQTREESESNGTPVEGPLPPNEKDLRVCIICLDQDAIMAADPCRHVAYCSKCVPIALSKPCPVCLCAVKGTVRAYRGREDTEGGT
eukprot:TRINITY_DN38864_c0_g1_i1.p1 TRINITY_DN38864_c0_g1~~TRINITY_DN38864_c0_g1_i1.p1  ORF type:complete len:498 (+),score=60.07 TRINITY_DN38864_c0_g1_i1:113-1606(+)